MIDIQFKNNKLLLASSHEELNGLLRSTFVFKKSD